MSIATKKRLSVLIFIFLGLFQFSLFTQVPSVSADAGLISSQEGFANQEIQSAFGNGEPQDLRYTVVRIIMVVLSILGVLFLGLIIFAGFKYMTAAGNEDQVKGAIKQITQAVIGLVIILSAWGISAFILNQITKATTTVN